MDCSHCASSMTHAVFRHNTIAVRCVSPNVRRGDPHAKPCCKTFHPPCMCIGFCCALPLTVAIRPAFKRCQSSVARLSPYTVLLQMQTKDRNGGSLGTRLELDHTLSKIKITRLLSEECFCAIMKLSCSGLKDSKLDRSFLQMFRNSYRRTLIASIIMLLE